MRYADDADVANEGNVAAAFRLRATRHANLEQLTSGGFLNKPDFDKLKKDVDGIVVYMAREPWPVHTQKLWTQRQVQELCSTPGAVLRGLEKFGDLTFSWPRADDGAGPHKWDAASSKCRHMDLDPSNKLKLFVELFTEFAAGPLISNGEQGHA